MTITHDVAEKIARVGCEVGDEVAQAIKAHKAYTSPNEGWAVMLEELDGLWEHIRAKSGRSDAAREEAIQIAATAIRYVMHVCDGVK